MKTKRKNIFKSLLALTLALIMVLGVAPLSELAGVDFASLFAPKAEAAGKTYGIYTYVFSSDNKVTITDCKESAKGAITIPSEIDGKSVTSIGPSAFYGCTGLTSITIPNSVTSIGDWAFWGCTGLTSINVASGNNYYSGINGVLFNKKKTELIKYPAGKSQTSYTIPNSVTSIEDGAFGDCSGLTSITIPNSVTSIGIDAFYYCTGLTSITIPNSVTSIGDWAFRDCSGLTSINVASGNNYYSDNNGVLFNKEKTALIRYPEGKSQTSYTIPNSVTSIGDGAFWGCTGLTSITIPNSVTSIEDCAFAGCRSLTSITIPNSVTSIGDEAFKYCSDLTSITIPNSVTSIGFLAFYVCTGLTSIAIPNSVTSIGDGAFEDCTGLTSITIPNSVISIGGYAFWGCTGLKDVYYTGSKDEWKAISIGGHNDRLLNATIHYSNNSSSQLLLSKNEIYSFRNSDKDFGKKCKYGMIDSHIKKLSKYVDKIYSGSVWSVAYGAIINCNIALARKEAWGGSCHGMAVTTVLDKVGKINFNENFGKNARTMSEVQKPKNNKTVMSAINYYQLAQEIPAIERGKFYNMKSSEAAKGLKELVQAAKNNKLTLFSYRFRSGKKTYGHTIVVIGYEEMSNGNHRLVVYDNRYSSAYSYIDINSKYTSCTVNGEEKALSFNFITNFDTYDQIDIDGANNVYRAPAKIDSEVQSTEELPSRIKIDAVGEVTVKNAEGEELVVKDGETEGTMQVKNVSFVCNSDSEGNPAAATIVIDVENSKSFTFTSTDNNMNVAVCSPGIFADVNSVNADSVKIEENEGIFVSGDNMDVEAALSAKNNYCDMVGISGSAEKDMSMTYSDDDINIDGVKGDCTVDVYSDTVNFDTVAFESAYDSITVSDNGSGKVGLMDVKASSKNDGVYDINLAESTPDREVTLTLNDKNDVLHVGDSYAQEYSATADWKIYNISWTSSDDTVAEVDEDGVIGAVGCGKAEITATAYDEEGNVLSSDTIEITVVGESNAATGITLAAPTSPIPVGGSYQLVAAAQPDGASLPDLVWASSDPSVASVDENGLVKALSVGTATISVTDTASNLSAEVEIDTVQVIDFGDGGTTIKVGEKLIYTPVIQEDYVDYHYRWSSSDPSVVTVEPNEGELTGIKEGTATITMTLVDDDGNIIASSDFTVTVEKKDGFFKILFRIITAPFRAIINLFKKLFGK